MAITASRLQVDVSAETGGLRRGLDEARNNLRDFANGAGGLGGNAGENFGDGFNRDARNSLGDDGFIRDPLNNAANQSGEAGARSGRQFAEEFAERANDRLKGFGKMLGQGLMVGAAAAGAGLTAAVMSASDLAETMSKVGVVFGDAQGEVTAYADRMAKDFGAPKQAILDAASSIGLIGKASGMSQGEAAKMSTEMAQLAVDASSFYNVPLDEALAAIQSGLVGEAEPMRRFGVLLSEDALKAEALALGLSNGTGELTEQAKAQARASLIMKGMTDASGDLARTQGSLSNQLREVQGRALNFASTVGTELLPHVLKGMDVLGDLAGTLQTRLSPVFKEITGGVKAFAAAFKAGNGDVTSSGFAGFMERLGNAARTFYDAMKPVVSFIGDNLVPIFAGIGAALTAGGAVVAFGTLSAAVAPLIAAFTGASGVIAGIGAVLVAAVGPVALVAAGIAGLVAGLVYAYKNSETFREGIQKAFNFLAENVPPIIETIRSFLLEKFGEIVAWTKENWPAIQEAITHVMNVVSDVIGVAVRVVTALWDKFGNNILAQVQNVWNTIKGVISGVLDVVKNVIGLVVNVINGDWGKAWDNLKGIFVGAWDTVFALLKGLGGTIKNLLGIALEGIGTIAKAAFNALKPAAVSGAQSLWDWLKGLPGMIGGFLLDAGSWLVKTGWNLLKGLVTGLGNALVDLGTFFLSLPITIAGYLLLAHEWLVDTGRKIITGLVNGIVEYAPKVWEFMTSLPGRIWELLGDVNSWLREKGQALIQGAVNGITEYAPRIWDFFKALPGRVLSFLGNLGATLLQKGRDLLGGAKKGAEEGGNSLLEFVKGLPGRIINDIGNMAELLFNKGKDIVQGLINGIKAVAGSITTTIRKEITDKIPKVVADRLNIKSPSRVMEALGREIPAGLAQGIYRGYGAVEQAMGGLSAAATGSVGFGGLGAFGGGNVTIEAGAVSIDVNGSNLTEAELTRVAEGAIRELVREVAVR